MTNSTDFLPSSFALTASGACSSGEYNYVGSGDRGGTAWLGANGSLIYRSQMGHMFFGFADTAIVSASSLRGMYAAIRYDSNPSATTPISAMYINIGSDGSTATAQKYSDAFAGSIAGGGSALTETLTITAINSPRNGMIRGTLTGAYTTKVQCVVGQNLTSSANTKDAVLCAGQSPSDANARAPFNLYMVSTKDYPSAPDKTWNNTGNITYTYPSSNYSAFLAKIAVQTDGKIIAAGQSGNAGYVVRFNSDGVVDTSYATAGARTISSSTTTSLRNIVLQPDGKAIIVGAGASGAGVVETYIARLTTTGAFDTTFNSVGYKWTDASPTYSEHWTDVKLATDGKIVTSGYALAASTQWMFGRFNTDGTLDTTFNPGGSTPGIVLETMAANANAVAIQTDGKVLGGGYDNSGFSIKRYNSDGAVDTTFATAGKIRVSGVGGGGNTQAITVLSDGKILATGIGYVSAVMKYALVRLTTSGALDTTFNGSGYVLTSVGASNNHAGYNMALQADGKILVVGYGSADTSFSLVRYNTDGSLDTTFGSSGKLLTSVGDSPLQVRTPSVGFTPDGRILVSGVTRENGSSNFDKLILYRFWP